MPEDPTQERKQTIDAKVARRKSRCAHPFFYTDEQREVDAAELGLDEGEQNILDDLENAARQMQHYYGWPFDRLEENQDQYEADLHEYERAVVRTIRARLWHHPIVQMWISARRSLGERDELRRFRLPGLERDAKRPWSKDDLWLAYEAGDRRCGGEKIETIRRYLIGKLEKEEPDPLLGLEAADIKRLLRRLKTPQNFHKWFKRVVG